MSSYSKSAYHNRLAAGHNFLVFFGSASVSFARISGLTNEINIETINEGGVNDAMVMLTSPRKKLGTVVYEHGVGLINPLSAQFEIANNAGVIFTYPTTILVFDNYGTIKRAFGYNGGIPVKWSISDLNAQSGEIVMDRLEVLHQGFFNVPI